MPIYEYRCADCHLEFERMQKVSDPPVDSCPSCAGTVQKLISRSAFHLKGDGWYVTDYARKSGGNGSSNTTSDSDSSSSSSDSSTKSSTGSESTTSTATTKTSSESSSKTASAPSS